MDHPLDIAEAADCGVDALPGWETALAHLLAAAVVLAPEEIGLEAAAGRVLAVPVIAPRSRPARDLSAMDGYAIAGAAPTPGAELPVIGRAWAGKPFPGPVAAGQAVRVTTGAPMPSGAERVIVDEAVSVEEGCIRLTGLAGQKLLLIPTLVAMSGGDPATALAWRRGSTIAGMAASGDRETLILAATEGGGVRPLERQESASHAHLARLTALIRRPPASPPAAAGDLVDYLDL